MTAWDVFWFFFLFVPLTLLWIAMLIDVLGRRDLVGWQKALWVMGIIFFPWIGIFAYLVLRPREAASPVIASAGPPPAQTYKPQSAPTGAPSQVTGDARGAVSG